MSRLYRSAGVRIRTRCAVKYIYTFSFLSSFISDIYDTISTAAQPAILLIAFLLRSLNAVSFEHRSVYRSSFFLSFRVPRFVKECITRQAGNKLTYCCIPRRLPSSSLSPSLQYVLQYDTRRIEIGGETISSGWKNYFHRSDVINSVFFSSSLRISEHANGRPGISLQFTSLQRDMK